MSQNDFLIRVFAAHETLGKEARLEFNSSWWRLALAVSSARARVCVCVCSCARGVCVWITEEALAGITSISNPVNLQDPSPCMSELSYPSHTLCRFWPHLQAHTFTSYVLINRKYQVFFNLTLFNAEYNFGFKSYAD